MGDFSEFFILNRVNPILSDFSHYKEGTNKKNKEKKKEYSEIMKEASKKLEKFTDDGNINMKI